MRRFVPAIAVVLIVAILAVFAFFPSAPAQETHSTSRTATPTVPTSAQTFFEKQMYVTTGIAYSGLVLPSVPPTFEWETSLRPLTTAIISIQAELNISDTAPPVVVSRFVVPLFAVIGPDDPLTYNLTAYMNATDLTPPANGSFYVGESFPETVTVTFQNGTSTVLSVSAQVFAPLS